MRSRPNCVITNTALMVVVFLTTALLTTAARSQVGTTRPNTKKVQKKSPIRRTILSVELLADKRAGGFIGQQWGRTFEKIGYSVRIRRTVLDEKPEIKERMLGRLREIRVIGRLDRRGKLIFSDRTFSPGEGSKLAEWLRSLQVYGAQGSPKGRPVWGLSKSQFDRLFRALSEKVSADIEGLTFDKALARLSLPQQYPVRLATSASGRLRTLSATGRPVRHTLKGHSKGTALALLLGDYGLGFRPLRTPERNIELAIESLEKTTDVWPIGWDLKNSRAQTAPKMFKFVPEELEKVKLVDALEGISALTDIPVHIDRFGIEARGINVDDIVVSYPPKKTSWSLLLRAVTVPHKLSREFRIDEQGKPFVWVTALVPRRSRK